MDRSEQGINHHENKERLETPKITVIFDGGSRARINHELRAIRKAIVDNEANDVIHASNENRPDLDDLDPSTTLVVALSSTIDFSYYEDSGFTVYPSSENLRRVSNKKNLYNKCRELGIPTALTFSLPETAYSDGANKRRILRLNQALTGTVVKPENTFSSNRTLLRAMYPNENPEDIDNYVTDGKAGENVDYVIQKKLGEPVIKAWGAWPDQFFYRDETGIVKPCPPNIQRTCRLLCEEFDIRWGGLDFMVDENGTWLIIDINPPSGGRSLPKEYVDEFSDAMQENVESVVRGEKIPTRDQKIEVMIAAAGKSSRMQEVTGGNPKSLLELDNGKKVIDYSTETAQQMAQAEGFSGRTTIFAQEQHTHLFEEWRDERNLEGVDVVHPDESLFENPSSFNHTLACLPESSDLVVVTSADRINLLTDEQIEQLTELIRKSLQEDEVPYLVIGVRDDSSKHRYITDQNGTILEYHREQGGNSTTGIGIKKIAFSYNVAKITVTEARNSYEVVNRQMSAGSLGRLIVIDGDVKHYDVDTPEEWKKLVENDQLG